MWARERVREDEKKQQQHEESWKKILLLLLIFVVVVVVVVESVAASKNIIADVECKLTSVPVRKLPIQALWSTLAICIP